MTCSKHRITISVQNNNFCSNFLEVYPEHRTPEEGRRAQQLKRCHNSKKDVNINLIINNINNDKKKISDINSVILSRKKIMLSQSLELELNKKAEKLDL